MFQKHIRFFEKINGDRAPENRLLISALFIQAVVKALKQYPEFNGYYVDGQYQPSPAIHLGLAINIRGAGLVAPAILNAEEKDLETAMNAMRDLVTRVRAGRFRSSELSDPTITVSSLGERGVSRPCMGLSIHLRWRCLVLEHQRSVPGLSTERLNHVIRSVSRWRLITVSVMGTAVHFSYGKFTSC